MPDSTVSPSQGLKIWLVLKTKKYRDLNTCALCTDKKENNIFLKYKEIQNRAFAKSLTRKGFLIYD
jgi:hypothetical protein